MKLSILFENVICIPNRLNFDASICFRRKSDKFSKNLYKGAKKIKFNQNGKSPRLQRPSLG